MTTLAFVSLQSDGEREFAFYRNPGADQLYRTTEVDFSYINNINIFHFGSISLIEEPVKTTTLDLIKYAKKHNVITSYDPNLRPPLWNSLDQAKNVITNTLQYADILKLNEEEVKFLTGINIANYGINEKKEKLKKLAKAGKYIYDLGPKLVIITLGNEGCYYFNGHNNNFLQGVKVKAIDTTGAGDGFIAAVLSKINQKLKQHNNLKNISEEEYNKLFMFANKVGSIVTTKNGGIPSLPTLNEIKKY